MFTQRRAQDHKDTKGERHGIDTQLHAHCDDECV